MTSKADIPPVQVTIAACPAAEGRAVHLVGDAVEARRLVAQGRIALGPETWAALADIAAVFPGSRVVELRRLG